MVPVYQYPYPLSPFPPSGYSWYPGRVSLGGYGRGGRVFRFWPYGLPPVYPEPPPVHPVPPPGILPFFPVILSGGYRQGGVYIGVCMYIELLRYHTLYPYPLLYRYTGVLTGRGVYTVQLPLPVLLLVHPVLPVPLP